MPDAFTYLALAGAIAAALLLAGHGLHRQKALRRRLSVLESALSEFDRQAGGVEARLDGLAAGIAAAQAGEVALRSAIVGHLHALAATQRRMDADLRIRSDRRAARLRSEIAGLARSIAAQEQAAEAEIRRHDAAVAALSERLSALVLAIDRLEDGPDRGMAVTPDGNVAAPGDGAPSRMRGLAMPARVISVIGP